MRITPIACICIGMLIAASCKNDIEINAPWKETPVVYAFLDPNTNTQFFRIQKTYQNSTDLTTAQGAQIADSLYFDTLAVKVIDGNKVYTFSKTKNTPKDDGFFASGAHFLYECKNFTATVDRRYTLQIFSPKTGKTYSSSTLGVGTSKISAVRLRFDATNTSSSSTITTSISDGSVVYNQTMRLVYVEYTTDSTNADTLFADYNLNEFTEPYNPGTGSFRIKTSAFINGIKNVIPVKSGYTRKVLRIDFINVGGGKELADLIELTTPSISVVQKKIDYSNITEGLGIFSSRSYKYTANIESFEAQWPTQRLLLTNALNATNYEGITSLNLHFSPHPL